MLVSFPSLLGLLFVSRGTVVRAQTFDVPSNWQNTSTSFGRADREVIATRAANALLPHIESGQGTIGGFNGFLSASLISVLSLQDYFGGNAIYKHIVETSVQVYGQQNPNYFWLDPMCTVIRYWGLALFYAYRAYHDDFLLATAKSLWNVTSAAFISSDDAQSFKQASRNVTIKPDCDALTIAGGVFWGEEIRNSTIVNGETIGPWLTLSAYLYEATGSQQYLTAAQASADFMQFHLLEPGHYVYDSYDVVKCVTNNQTVTYNSGWFIEGMSVLANVTQNSTQARLLYDLVPGVVTQNGWTLNTGVNSEVIGPVESSAGALKGTLIRGLTEMRSRFANETQLASLIEAYITVQFNSILANARAGTSDNYTASWIGPAPTEFQGAGNVAALDVFNSMFSFAPPEEGNASSSATPPSSDSTPITARSSTSHVGAIVGGVVGGVGGIAVLAGLLLFIRRRQSRSISDNVMEKTEGENARLRHPRDGDALEIQPFMEHHAVVGTPLSSSYASVNLGTAKPGRFVEVISDDGHHHGAMTEPSAVLTVPSTSTTGPAGSDGFVQVERNSITAAVDDIPNLVAQLNHLLRRQEARSPTNELPPPAYGA